MYKGNSCDVINAFVEYKGVKKKTIEKEFKTNFHDRRKFNGKEKEKYVKKQLSKLSFPRKIQQFVLTDLLLDFDGTSLDPGACEMKNRYTLKMKRDMF